MAAPFDGMRSRRWHSLALPIAGIAALVAFASCRDPPLPTVPHVDLARFLGDWFVIAHIPAGSEANADNAIESYAWAPDGTIAMTYVFRDGAFDAPFTIMRPNAVVEDAATNAIWGMQFFWPLRFECRITHLDADSRTTIVSRSARDYAWIMARTPQIAEDEHALLQNALRAQGYNVDRLRRVPQRWPDPEHPTFSGRPQAAPR